MKPPKKAILATGSLTHTVHAIDAFQCPLTTAPPQRWAILCEETGAIVWVRTKGGVRDRLARLTTGAECVWGDYEMDRAKLLGVDLEELVKQAMRSIRPVDTDTSPRAGGRARVDDFLQPVDADANTWKRSVRAAVTRVDPDAIFASLIDQMTATKPIIASGGITEWPDFAARSRATEFILSYGDGRPSTKDDLAEKKSRESFSDYVSDSVEADGTMRSKARLRRTLTLDILDRMGDDEIDEQLLELQARVAKRGVKR